MGPMIMASAPPLPVLAIVEPTKETFSGSIRGETLVIRSDSGPGCSGRVRVDGYGYGFGSLSCSDGRYGNFTLHMVGRMGTASGSLDGKDFTLTVG